MLLYKADLRSLFSVACYFGATVYFWINYEQLNSGQIALVVALLCLISFMCAVIVHNTIHVPIFKNRLLNRFFQIVLSMTYGHPVSAFVAGHNLSHHQYTGDRRDIARTTRMRFRINFFNQLFFFFLTSDRIMRLDILFLSRMWRERNFSWLGQYLVELILVFGIKMFLTIINWEAALLLLWIPHFYAQWGIVGTNYWQHDGCDVSSGYNHSRNFTNKILNLFFFNNGFHGIHHNNPRIHWSKLPERYAADFESNVHPNLNRKWLISYLWESCIWPGKRKDYLGNPVILPKKELDSDKDWVEDEDLSQNSKKLGAAY